MYITAKGRQIPNMGDSSVSGATLLKVTKKV